jgi:hypothetical protein
MSYVDRDLERRLMSDLNMLAVAAGKERSALEWKSVIDKAALDSSVVAHDVHQRAEGIAHEEPPHSPWLIGRTVLDRDLRFGHL